MMIKILKKTAALMLAAVLALGILQVPAFADPGEPIVINGFGLWFDEPHEGDHGYPDVGADLTEGIEILISFLTKDKNLIDPIVMIEGQEYFAAIQVRADVANGYEFFQLDNEPCLTLSVNGDSLSFISGGMPDDLYEGYFVTDPTAPTPYNNITILKKFEAQNRINWTFDAQLTVEGENNIKVGETAAITISEIDVDKDRVTEYTWKVIDESGEERIYRVAEDKFNFTPDMPGTYSINLSHVKLDDCINLEPADDNHVEITVTEEPKPAFTATIKADKENIRLGETVIITAEDIENQDTVTEYSWQISNETGLVGKPKTAENTINFTPDNLGVYRISLVGILYQDGTSLDSGDSYIDITVDDETAPAGNSDVPETGDKFEMISWLIVFALAAGIIIVTARKRKEH